MASGQQLAEENVRLFNTWVASKNDDDYREMVVRGCLSRSDIAKECGFAKSVLAQNPRVKTALLALETELRQRGVLPQAVQAKEAGQLPEAKQSGSFGRADHERLRRLELENALLRATNEELKYALSKETILHEALALTGRLPR